MHIKYPRQKGFFTWEELGCLAKALGYQRTLFYKNIPPEYHKDKIPGLDIKDLLTIMEMKALHGDIHQTYNMHDALYNCSVIEKALDMLSNKYLSFQELREVRVAFQLYEHEDMLGLVINEHILMRTLKACGRSVSPIKLMQHIKHTDTHVEDRLMLYEFLELLLLCERESDVNVSEAPHITGKDPRNSLYKICDFQSILVPNDEKKISQLNSLYEQSLSKPNLKSKSAAHRSWHEEQPFLVDREPRLELVNRHRPGTIELTDHLSHSNRKVMNARCGRTMKGAGRPFVDLNDFAPRKVKRDHRMLISHIDTPFEDVPETLQADESVASRVNFASTPQECLVSTERPDTSESHEDYVKTFPGTTPHKLSRMSRTREREILVTPRDVHNSNTKIQNLNWDIETQTVRLKRKSDRYLQEKYPDQYKIISRRYEHRKPKSPFAKQEISCDSSKDSSKDKSHQISLETEVKFTSRRQNPTRDTIYTTLKSRLEKTDSLLDFGDVSVPYSPFSEFLSKQLQRKKDQKPHKTTKQGPRTLKVENLGTLPGEEDLGSKDSHHDGEVMDLLEKFHEADFVATGKKAFGDKQSSWQKTTFV